MQNYENLEIYKGAEDLALQVYSLTNKFPISERSNIVPQMRRAATSICANIAEGTGRGSDADFLRFLYNSMGSLKEIGSFLRISYKLGYLQQAAYESASKKTNSLGNMLGSLIKYLKKKPQSSVL